MEYGLYLHIPYCQSRCRYCNFHSAAPFTAVPQPYVEALLRALEEYRPRKEDGSPLAPVTVYFGGGTPGLLSQGQVQSLLAAAAPAPEAEITLEVNPGGDDIAKKLLGFRRAGVNRLSFGVQTAQDAALRRLGRPHTAEDARLALRAARSAGFGNVSGDIMLALPGYTRRAFDETLTLLAEEGASHISAYLLKIEPETPFGKAPPQDLPTEDAAADFYLYAAERLEAFGYHRYEISNFAKPGCQSRHNLLYWNCEEYLGLGPAAHSCLGGRRFSFPANTPAFIEGRAPLQEEGKADAEDYLMLRLRLEEGLWEDEWQRRFGGCFTPAQTVQMQNLAKRGLVRKTPRGWALSGQGLLVQNQILASLLE